MKYTGAIVQVTWIFRDCSKPGYRLFAVLDNANLDVPSDELKSWCENICNAFIFKDRTAPAHGNWRTHVSMAGEDVQSHISFHAYQGNDLRQLRAEIKQRISDDDFDTNAEPTYKRYIAPYSCFE